MSNKFDGPIFASTVNGPIALPVSKLKTQGNVPFSKILEK